MNEGDEGYGIESLVLFILDRRKEYVDLCILD